MDQEQKYNIDLEVMFGPLEVIDVPALAASFKDQWTNRTLIRVNDSLIRLAVIQGEFHWHKHDLEDEFFFVLEGKLLIDLEGETVELKPLQGFSVPKGVVHRTRSLGRTAVLVVEGSTVQPTGD